jgi:hypothetical protein
LRNLKSEKCSELLDDIKLIDSLKNSKWLKMRIFNDMI